MKWTYFLKDTLKNKIGNLTRPVSVKEIEPVVINSQKSEAQRVSSVKIPNI